MNLLEKINTDYKAGIAAGLSASENFAKFQLADHTDAISVWGQLKFELLDRFKPGNEKWVLEFLTTHEIAAEVDPTSTPAYIYWKLKCCVSIAHAADVYDRLNVKLTVVNIKGESFYGGKGEHDIIDEQIGHKLLKLDVF